MSKQSSDAGLPAVSDRPRPIETQRRYLERGLEQPGGKLPLFDRDGRAVSRQTVESCIAHGWATPWFANPTKPDWLVCKLTPAGYAVLGREPPPQAMEGPANRGRGKRTG